MRTMRFPILLLPVLFAVCTALRAEPLLVTQAQLDEYFVASGEASPKPGDQAAFDRAREALLQHTLLAKAWEGEGRRLDSTAISRLREDHLDVAIRVLKERRLRIVPPAEADVLEYAVLAKSVYWASHILLDDEERADSVRSRLADGDDFARLAGALSIDPGADRTGGYLGEVRAGDTVMEFEEALFRLKPGEVSGPVESPFGWHLIRLDSLVDLAPEWSDEDMVAIEARLQDRARRRAETAQRRAILADHGIALNERLLRRGGTPGDTVLVGRDTLLVRSELEQAVDAVFGPRAAVLGPDLTVEYLRFWALRDAWRREALAAGIFEDDEVLDRMDVRERLLKSTLFVSEVVEPAVRWDDTDLFNYLVNHEYEFLAERAFGVWRFEFPSLEEAAAAGRAILEEGLEPKQAAARWAPDARPYELSAAEARALPGRQSSTLVDLDPRTWSGPVENGISGRDRRWLIWHLVGRRMPDIDESAELRAAVAEKVRLAMLDGAIAHTTQEMRKLTGWTETVVVR